MNENDMIHWVREAAERGDAEAAMKLGESYMKCEREEKNEEEAQAWFRKTAELKRKNRTSMDFYGVDRAPVNVGILHRTGIIYDSDGKLLGPRCCVTHYGEEESVNRRVIDQFA